MVSACSIWKERPRTTSTKSVPTTRTASPASTTPETPTIATAPPTLIVSSPEETDTDHRGLVFGIVFWIVFIILFGLIFALVVVVHGNSWAWYRRLKARWKGTDAAELEAESGLPDVRAHAKDDPHMPEMGNASFAAGRGFAPPAGVHELDATSPTELDGTGIVSASPRSEGKKGEGVVGQRQGKKETSPSREGGQDADFEEQKEIGPTNDGSI